MHRLMRFGLHTLLRKIIPQKSLRAFTAFETLIAVTILAIITAAVSGALSAGRQQVRAASELLQARMHAEALMTEVLRLPPSSNISKTGPSSSSMTRASRADLQDYNNYTDGPSNIQDLSGTVYPADMQGYVRKITVTRLGTTTFKRVTLSSPCVVTVTVTRDGRSLVNQSRLVPG